MTETVREQVRERYAAAARSVAAGTGGCCGGSAEPGEGSGFYPDEDRAGLPVKAVAASLGCGNPFLVADLEPGDTVLDLGSGGGIDVLLSARRVGPTGRAYGLDMTDEMLELARHNAAEASAESLRLRGVDEAANVEFLRGHIEDIPLPDASVDVVISNCVINLSDDKAAVFAEIFRVLRPGGRLGVSDVVAEDRLTPAQRAERGDWAGCTAGALSESEYLRGLADTGFVDASVTFTQDAGDGMHSALIRARKPV